MKVIYSKRTKQAVGTITLLALFSVVVAMLPIKAHSGDLINDVITEDAETQAAENKLPDGSICHKRNGKIECGVVDAATGDLVWTKQGE